MLFLFAELVRVHAGRPAGAPKDGSWPLMPVSLV